MSSAEKSQDDNMDPAPERPARLLTFASGGWVIALAILLCAAVVVKAIGSREPNGFDLSNARVPSERFEVGFKRDGLPPLVDPPAFLQPELESKWGKKYLVSDDRVLGVHINGEARCYPLRMLNWHEVVNDVVGGQPILVTFHGPCDSAVVFDRRIDDKAVVFGHSGMTFNGNFLFYDQQSDYASSSLFLQLRGEAIAGPKVGTKLRPLACEVVSYEDWINRYPSSTVVPGMHSLAKKCYKKRAYSAYLAKREVQFEIDPLPPVEDPRDRFEQIVVLTRGSSLTAKESQVLFFEDIAREAGPDGAFRTEVFPGVELDFVYAAGSTSKEPASVRVRKNRGADVAVSFARHFAWYAAQNVELRPAGYSEPTVTPVNQ